MRFKITEEQLDKLQEKICEFGFMTGNDMPQYPQDQVMAATKDGETDFGKPMTADDLANTMTKQYPWGAYAYARGNFGRLAEEQGSISDLNNDQDQTGDGVPDKFNHADANELNDDNPQDDMSVIPYSIIKPLNMLVDAVKQANLPAKKQVNVINYIVDKLDLQGIQPSYKKETMMKVFNKQ